MANEAFVFAVYDQVTGLPKTGIAGSLSFLTYKDDLGNNLAQPSFTEIGGGLYKFTPSFTVGRAIVFMISTANAPQYLAGYCRPEDFNQWAFAPSPALAVFGLFDPVSGSPKTGATPTFSIYDDQNGGALTPVSITEIGGGLYKFIPSFANTNEIAYEISTGQSPAYYTGFLRVEDFSTTGFSIVSAVGSPNTITLSFASGYQLDALPANVLVAANWTVTGAPGVTVTNVQLISNQVILTTTAQGNGVTYTLNVPTGITANSGTFPLLGPFAINFTGAAGDPILVQARSVDERTVDVFYSFAPQTSRALDITNYSITPGLTITSIQQLGPTWYRLTTSVQTIGQTYTVTWPLH